VIDAHLGVDGNQMRSIRRAVSIGLLDCGSGRLRRPAAELLAFPSVQAARHATRRARQLDGAMDVRRLVEIISSIAG